MIMNASSKVSKKQGLNRAELKGYACSVFENYVVKGSKEGICVFISHNSQDKADAMAIADYLRSCNIDIYIDMDDEKLQKATAKGDAKSIVEHIQDGLKYSTHLLALISDKTTTSWWVPYEIGYAKNAGKKIASLLLKKTNDDFPDYLKIETMLVTTSDVEDYAEQVLLCKNRYGDLFESVKELPDSSVLEKYVRIRK